MRKKMMLISAILLAVVMFFSGCEALTFNSPENLVRPPKLSGDDGELQSAFEKAVSEKGEFILKYPSAGEYRSAYVRYDCDGDGKDEAFVFYSLRAEEMSVYMYMLDYKDGRWQAVGELPGEGNDVYSIEFCDLNADGTAEVFVGWSSIDSKANKKLCIYYSDNSQNLMNYNMLAIESYTAMYVVDIDFDGHKEILTALINSTSDTYTTEAKLLKMTVAQGATWQISPIGQVSLYSGITAINNITSGLSGGRRYIYIDEAAGDSYLTEMLYWDNEQNTLSSAFKIDTVSIANCPTSRSLPLNCADVNGDGELEIPVTKLMQDSGVVRSKTEPAGDVKLQNVQAENIYIVSWTQFDEGRFTAVDRYIENSYDGFRIAYDEDLMKDWSVRFFADEGISQFYILKYTNIPDKTAEAVLLFTVNAIDVNEDAAVGSILATGEKFKYTYEITEEGEMNGLDRNELMSFFSLSPVQGDI